MAAQPRGTSNGNSSGSSYTRRRRKAWLLETYRADVDGRLEQRPGVTQVWLVEVPRGEGEKACRCYRCGYLLVFATLTVDRIIPGDKGGTYRRNNIRPACGSCNSITGNEYRWSKAFVSKPLQKEIA